jgi:hypothetical protein
MKVIAWYIDPNGIKIKIPSNTNTLLVSKNVDPHCRYLNNIKKREYQFNIGLKHSSYRLDALCHKVGKELVAPYPNKGYEEILLLLRKKK